MLPSRRLLPSTASLRALEALDRLGTATAVAEELSLTQSAVSRQIQTLEDQLGMSLVHRAKRKLRMTDAGAIYAADVRQALQQITNATLRVTTARFGGGINLAILPTFGMRWLVPRLADFARLHPDIIINMSTRMEPFNFATQPFDAAIHFGKSNWPNTGHLRLKTEKVIPVCTPDLAKAHHVRIPKDIINMPLLHLEARPDAWERWLMTQGHDTASLQSNTLSGAFYDQFLTITQAALHGLGVALLPDYLVEHDLAAQRLVVVASAAPKSLGAYYLVWPKDRENDVSLGLFREWLATQCEDGDGLPR